MADSSLTLDKTAVDAEDVHLEDQKPKKRFQKRTSAIKKPERVVETVVMDMRGFCGKLFMGKNPACTGPDRSPDADFHADSYVKLTHGVTAYRFIEPSTATDDTADDLPTVVLLHGLSNASYMWADVADLVCDSPQGPMARVLVFDFYGRGRSPWSGKDITLDTLVTQTKELLEFLDLVGRDCPQISFIGYDIGGAVAAGFAAKFPAIVGSLTLIAPVGMKYSAVHKNSPIMTPYAGDFVFSYNKRTLVESQKKDFFNRADTAPARPFLNKQMQMVRWQINNTPGYQGALLSTYRNFPLRELEELYIAVGRHPRQAMVIWGECDTVTNYREGMSLMEKAFPHSPLIDVKNAGHNCIAEKFDEVITEILCFHKQIYRKDDISWKKQKRVPGAQEDDAEAIAKAGDEEEEEEETEEENEDANSRSEDDGANN